MTYDAWKCSPPDEPEPVTLAPSYHDDCEQQLEERDDEIARLHAHIDELETELAAARSEGLSAYGRLFNAVVLLLSGCAINVSVGTARYAETLEIRTAWRVWWRHPSAPPENNGEQVTGATAEEALSALRAAIATVAVPTVDLTGVDALVRDGRVET